MKNHLVLFCFITLLTACQPQSDNDKSELQQPTEVSTLPEREVAYQQDPKLEDIKNQSEKSVGEKLMTNYATFTLTADLSDLTDNQKQMIMHLIEVAKIMDDLFWLQSYGDKNDLLASIEDSDLKSYAAINYGPWDRLNGDAPFIEGYGEKPLGARFYPPEMTKEEFNKQADDALRNLYTLVRTDEQGQLQAIPYHIAYEQPLLQAAEWLKKAAELAEDPDFKNYLQLRAKAILDDDYRASDMAWLDMKDNAVDVIVGPIETYEDQLFGYKAAYEAFVLIKDKAWSQKLAKYAQFLPQLQAELPVPKKYKQETPGTDSDLNAYDAVYYAGSSNAGSKTIAINLPNDEQVQLEKGTRRLQLKNAMHAKFEKILLPIAHELVVPEQRQHITFDAFFANTMFHEVAHGLGIKNTLTGYGTVREALKEYASAVEEGKADILGLYMVEKLYRMGELDGGELMDYYTTFMAGIFRSVRFGSSSAHGVANLLRFNYFAEQGAFNYHEDSGHYAVNPKKMSMAITSLSEKILTLQGDGNYQAVADWFKQDGQQSPQLQKALDTINQAGIPVDIVFQQGQEYLR